MTPLELTSLDERERVTLEIHGVESVEQLIELYQASSGAQKICGVDANSIRFAIKPYEKTH